MRLIAVRMQLDFDAVLLSSKATTFRESQSAVAPLDYCEVEIRDDAATHLLTLHSVFRIEISWLSKLSLFKQAHCKI